MKLKLLKSGVILLFGLGFMGVQAQQALPATAGMAKGSSGSVSYSIGQMVYTTNIGTNGSVSQGIQQPYEISVVTGINEVSMNISMSVFPNPTTGLLTLQILENNFGRFYYNLTDLQGKLIETKLLRDSQTQINLNGYSTGTYFLNVTQNSKIIKSFKIIKN